jgi:hypothetical protein
MIGIIPIGGNATRMNQIPKFLLPCKNKTLLDNIIHIYNTNEIYNLYAGVSDINNTLLQNNDKIIKNIVNTKTMTETIYQTLNSLNDKYFNYNCILLMPDTYITIQNEINEMKILLNQYQIVVLLWKIKDYQKGKVGQCIIEDNLLVDVIDKDINCKYPYFWGSIGWNSSINQYIDPNWDTIGNLLKLAIKMKIPIKTILCEGNYYDCGTYDEYFTMIKNEL